jgi:diguanylate cyclase (GGDEF)-like protein/PAS domain S-box-containing protein
MPLSRLLGSGIGREHILDQLTVLTTRIQQSCDLSEILNITVQEVRQILASDACGGCCQRLIIYRFLPNGDGVVAEEAVSPQCIPIRGQLICDPCFNEKWIEPYRRGRVSVISDIETAPLQACHREFLTRLQVRANLVVPILVSQQTTATSSDSLPDLWGLLIAQCSYPRQWNDLEIKMLQFVAAELGIVITQREVKDNKSTHNLQPAEEFLEINKSARISPVNPLPQIISLADLNAYDRLQTPIWIYDIENLQMWWANQAALYIWNANSREELLSRDFSDVSEATRIRLQSYLREFRQGEKIAENWTFYPGGQPVSVRCQCSGVYIAPGRMAMLIEGAIEKISEINQETLRSVEAMRHTTLMISLYTLDGVPLMQNPAARRCYGDTLHPHSPAENAFLRHFVDPSVGEQALTTIELGEVFSIETQVLTTQGRRWHGMDIRCTRDPVTGKSMILVNEKDITERQAALELSKNAEIELRWKEALLRSMTDTSLLAFYVVDNRTDAILYFNHRFCEIWGIEHLERQMQAGMVKNNDIIPNCISLIADVPAFAESCKPLQSEENRCTIEDEIAFVDGRTIRRFSSQIRDNEDRYFGRLYIFEDISDRQRLEKSLRLSDTSFECLAISATWINKDAKILRANQAACQSLGYSRAELESMYVYDLDPGVTKEAWPKYWQKLQQQQHITFISRHRRQDGSLIPVEVTINYLEFNGEEYNFAFFRDISERIQAETALREIYAITQRIRQSLDLTEILNTTVAEVRQFLQTDRVIVYRFNPDWSGVVVTESVDPGWKSLLNMQITDTYFVQTQGQSYQSNTIIATPDIYTAGFADCHVELLEQLQVRAKLIVPILQGERLWGLLFAHHCQSPREWQPWESELLRQLAAQVAIAIQQSELYQKLQVANQKLENLAMVDQLTQISNRRCFDLYLAQVWHYLLREQGCLSLLLCDIDYFKQYNDTYGHASGDTCLTAVAATLKQAVKRATDLVARYGGEEFAIILPNTDLEGAVQIAETIHTAIQQLCLPHAASNVKEHVTLSIGIATIRPTTKTAPLDLIEAADQALYTAKAQGRNRSCTKEI